MPNKKSNSKYYIPSVKPHIKKNRAGSSQMIWSRPIDIVCNVSGRGYWSDTCKPVNHYKMTLNSWADDDLKFSYGFYELKVFFYAKDWKINQHGLIYTDRAWIKDFRKALQAMGFSKSAIEDCDFSEQGMQGDNYVSLDAGPKFAKYFFEKLY